MKTVFLVRHGEVKNPDNIIYGRLPNFGLSDLGKQEVKQAAEYLKKIIRGDLKSIFVSPLLRTGQTARIISRSFPSVEILVQEGLVEGNLGWEGRKKTDLIKQGIWQTYLDQPSRITTGEGFLGIQKRIVSWLKQMIKDVKDSRFVVVTHQDVIRSLTLYLEKRPLNDLNEIPCNTGSVTTVKLDEDLKLLEPVLYWEPNNTD